MTRRFLLLFATACRLLAQDEVQASSPNGDTIFYLGVAKQEDPVALPRLAYQVGFQGKMAVDMSFLGYWISNQVPLLGEKPGLVRAEKEVRPGYTFLRAQYMQNGSLGRLVTIEARIYDGVVAFRYVLPRSVPLESLLIESEETEFVLARDGQVKLPTGTTPASKLATNQLVELPLVAEVPGVAWLELSESGGRDTPKVRLQHGLGTYFVTKLTPLPYDPLLSIVTTTPFTSPWRVIRLAASGGQWPALPALN